MSTKSVSLIKLDTLAVKTLLQFNVHKYRGQSKAAFVYTTLEQAPNQDGIKIATTMPTYRAIQSKLFDLMKKQHN
ncbi:hypothetical protein N476_24470 [Pseudoalteromonas luteoviolacea H33]|uniref:Uncharacterized protein n=1 Tax=Pseudoalteromonas luteoviolacea H33 TaxID=1365251 RepID=A0A167BFK0_9GAMM|nr:hypothetical protein N476_24470 [Pseudoalteromonas luteoviolacea H33]KZN79211.1 hypothetical protein N477_06060 [Pseudoalteromonas luteoviolacea H33-S]